MNRLEDRTGITDQMFRYARTTKCRETAYRWRKSLVDRP